MPCLFRITKSVGFLLIFCKARMCILSIFEMGPEGIEPPSFGYSKISGAEDSKPLNYGPCECVSLWQLAHKIMHLLASLKTLCSELFFIRSAILCSLSLFL